MIFLAGACSLIFELVWSRYLALMFGASVFAVTSVLTCYMLGMALGSWWIGRLVDRVRHGVALLVLLQIIIGMYGLLSPLLFMGAAHVNRLVFSNLEATPHLKHIVRLLISFIVLIIPTFAMGGTFPVLIKLISERLNHVGKQTSYAYWVTTLGGAFGAFITGFGLIRLLGLRDTVILASLTNLFVAGLAFNYFRETGSQEWKTHQPGQVEHTPREHVQDAHTSYPRTTRSLILLVFALSGFTSLAYQVFFTRVLTLFFRDSVYDFAIVLTTFLTGLALGSLMCGRFILRANRPLIVLAGVEALIGFFALLGLGLITRLPYLAGYLQSMPALYGEYGGGYWTAATIIKFGYAFLAMFLPTCFLGMTFPLVSAIWVRDIDRVGKDTGLLNGVNALGATLGALLAGFIFISFLGTHDSIRLMALLNIGLALSVISVSELSRKYVALACVVLMTFIASYLVPPWDTLRMSTSLMDPDRPIEQSLSLLYYNEDAYAITSVVELVQSRTKVLTTNRLYSQNTSVMSGLEDHRRLGYIPLMLHGKPDHVLVVGLGAGITLRGVSEYPTVKTIDCVEISEGVRKAAQYFAVENDDILKSRKISFYVEDGRNFISTSRRTYDVIIADIFFPMSSGSSAVFSREHFEASKTHLGPGGLMVQWLPAHQLSVDEIKIITRTFQTVFPHTSVWYGMIGKATPVIGLVGTGRRLEVDMSSLSAQYADPVFARNVEEIILDDPYMFMSNFILEGDSIRTLTKAEPINTDNYPIIEFTNPLLYDRFRTRGRDNMLRFHDLAEDIGPYIKPTGQAAPDLGAIKAILDRIRLGIRDILLNSK